MKRIYSGNKNFFSSSQHNRKQHVSLLYFYHLKGNCVENRVHNGRLLDYVVLMIFGLIRFSSVLSFLELQIWPPYKLISSCFI